MCLLSLWLHSHSESCNAEMPWLVVSGAIKLLVIYRNFPETFGNRNIANLSENFRTRVKLRIETSKICWWRPSLLSSPPMNLFDLNRGIERVEWWVVTLVKWYLNFMTNRTLHALLFQVRDVGAFLALCILKMAVRRTVSVLPASVIRIIATKKARSRSRPLSNAIGVATATNQPKRSVSEKFAPKKQVRLQLSVKQTHLHNVGDKISIGYRQTHYSNVMVF